MLLLLLPSIILLFRICLAAPAASQLQARQSKLPTYVLEYGMKSAHFTISLLTIEAPILWLSKNDQYNPSDIAAQVVHTIPKVGGNPVQGLPASLSLWNLDQLNRLGGTSVFLSAREGPASNAAWLKGVTPDANGKTNGAVSSTIITVDRGGGVLDVCLYDPNDHHI